MTGSWVLIACAAATAVSLLFITAPYGRHGRSGWGPTLPARLAWVLMESPSVVVYALAWIAHEGDARFAVIWLSHYVYRAFVYPFRGVGGRPMPMVIALMGASFNVFNSLLNAPTRAPPGWASDPRFWIGLALFYGGMWLNHDADARLRALRRPGETGYSIPIGGAFRWVSCPNYLGEIVEWFGWALLTWSLPGLAFALFTTANLAPRAFAHHAWYRKTFPDYPPERRALLPGV